MRHAVSKLFPAALALSALLAVPRAGLADAPDAAKATSLRNLGIAQLENEQPAAAEATFRELAQVLPGDPLPHADLAVALLRQQKTEEARAAIDRALTKAPGRPDLLAIKAEILSWGGDADAALALYSEALRRAPDDVQVAFSLERQASSMSGPAAEKATAEALEHLARLRPENAVVLVKLAQWAIGQGDRERATGALLRLKELLWQAPPAAGESLEKGLAALSGGDTAAARVPALRLENLIKVTPMYQQGLRELSQGLQGTPVARFAGEPPPASWGAPAAVRFRAERLDGAATPGRALVAADLDGDGKPDIARVAAAGGGETPRLELRLSTAELAAQRPAGAAGAAAGVAGLLALDLDNDGHLDLLGYGPERVVLWHNRGDGTFEAATEAFGLGKAGGAGAATLDYDIDGDLDLALAGGRAGAGALYRNNLEGALEAVGAEALPKAPGTAAGTSELLASDLDRDGDLDLLVVGGSGLRWLDNLRQGLFADRTADGGLAGAGDLRAVVSADLDDDGLPDLATAGPGLAVRRNRGGRFGGAEAVCGTAGGPFSELLALDADNDGRLDLAAAGAKGVAVCARRGDLRFETLPVEGETGALAGATALAAADLDGDGDLDLVAAGPAGLVRLLNEGGNGNRWLDVGLRGLAKGSSKNNFFGYGSTLEVTAGAAYQYREVTSDVTHFGLGKIAEPDVLRAVWTNGVPQDRLSPKIDQRIVEEQLLKGSCPFLYAWDGNRMRFVTDLLWGSPIGLPVAPGAWASSDPQELVRVAGAEPRGGRYDLVVTEELWEAAFFDSVRLWVVDVPGDVEVASSLRIVPGQRVPVRLLGARHVRPVALAWDGRGRDATAAVARRDDVYADGYRTGRYQGASRPWSFTFDLGEAPGRPVRLLLDGWIFPADASLNLAVAQRDDLPYLPPRLEVETADGWRTLMPSMGHPAGKTKTMVVDTPPLPPGAHRLRIVTSLWISWDRIAWSDEPADRAARVVARLRPESADLHFRGFSRMLRVAPNGPHAFDFDDVTERSPWLPFPGRYTRYGDVRELLSSPDDRSVILASGDALDLAFDAAALPAPPPGCHRAVFLESHGWDKDADRNTFEPERVGPLPFRAMSGYPYGPGERFPDTPEMRRYVEEWLTREVAPARPFPKRPVP